MKTNEEEFSRGDKRQEECNTLLCNSMGVPLPIASYSEPSFMSSQSLCEIPM